MRLHSGYCRSLRTVALAAVLATAALPAAAQGGASPGTPAPSGTGRMNGPMSGGGPGGMMSGKGQMGWGSTGGGPMMGGGMMPGGVAGMMMGDHVEGRLAFLKTELHITDAQAKVWDAFAEAMRSAAKNARTMHESMAAGFQGAWPQRLAQHEKMLAAHLDALKAVRAAAEPLYAALDADQKKTADELMDGHMMGGW